MDKEIVNKFMVEMLEVIKAAKDFTVQQLPEVAKEVLKYNMLVSIEYVLLGFFVTMVGVAGTIWSFKNEKELGEATGPAIIVGILIAVVGAFIFLPNFDDFLKIYFAPRVFLIEYFTHLVK